MSSRLAVAFVSSCIAWLGCTSAPAPDDAVQSDAARVVLDARPAIGCQAQASPPRLRVGQVAADGRRCLILQFHRGDVAPVQYEHVTVTPGVPMLLLRTEETCEALVSRPELPTDEDFGEFPAVGTGPAEWLGATSGSQRIDGPRVCRRNHGDRAHRRVSTRRRDLPGAHVMSACDPERSEAARRPRCGRCVATRASRLVFGPG